MTNYEQWENECLRKKRFRTKEFVESLIKTIKERDNKQMYYYMCSNCQNYHLTKREQHNNRYKILRVC